MMNETETSLAELHFDPGASILHIRIKNSVVMDIANLTEHYRKIQELTGGRKYFALVDVSRPYFIDHDGITYAADPETLQNRVAAAYYSPPLSNRLSLMNLQQHLHGRIPIFVASEKHIALKWLGTIKDKIQRS